MTQMFQHSFLLLLFLSCANAAKILGIFPIPSFSHQKLYQNIMKALVAKGHEVTVIGTDPLKEPIENYTEVDISFAYKLHKNENNFEDMVDQTPYEFLYSQVSVHPKLADNQLSSPQLQGFLRSNKIKYDLVLLEELFSPCYHGLVHHLGSPTVIAISPIQYFVTQPNYLALLENPSYVPSLLFPFSDSMSFLERLQNTFFLFYARYMVYTVLYPENEKVMRKHFGTAPPSIIEAMNNKSLFLVGTSWMFNYPLALPPSAVTFHNANIKTALDPLPKDIQEFIDNAPNGVIFMSFGSNVQSARVSNEKIQIFVDVFSQLPLKVLWKWESDVLPAQIRNIKFRKWLPQQEILAHKNTKLFITHCGLHSLQEAVYYAVPMLVFPFFGDQPLNAKKVHTKKIGLQMSIHDISKDALLNAINKIYNDSSFRHNAKMYSALAKDTLHGGVEKAVWWTEYVLRHKGARHLRSAALDMNWYQYLLLDVIIFLILSASIILFFFSFIIYKIFRYFSRNNNLI